MRAVTLLELFTTATLAFAQPVHHLNVVLSPSLDVMQAANS